jgi:hypothetical protein
MAFHVRGTVLPDGEVRDLWLVGDRVTFEPVADAETISDGGFILPGLVDAHCHLGIAYGAKPIQSVAEARELSVIDRDAGVLALRDAGSPFPYPELDDEPGVPRLARAGRHVAAPRRYLRDIGVEVAGDDVATAVTEQAKAGTGWVNWSATGSTATSVISPRAGTPPPWPPPSRPPTPPGHAPRSTRSRRRAWRSW